MRFLLHLKIGGTINEETYLPPPSIEDFKWLDTDEKVAYIFLKGVDESQNEKLTERIETIVKELNETDGSAYFTSLNSDNEHFEDVVERTGVKDLPTVVVLGRGCKLSLISENVNSTKLIRAYVSATTPAASCAPGGKNTSCCIKKSK